MDIDSECHICPAQLVVNYTTVLLTLNAPITFFIRSLCSGFRTSLRISVIADSFTIPALFTRKTFMMVLYKRCQQILKGQLSYT